MQEQLPLAVGQSTRPALADFVIGRNAEVVDAVRRASHALFIYGGPGTGKTHLLRGRARLQPGAIYLQARQLVDASDDWMDGIADAPWLGIDDIEAIADQRDAGIRLARILDRRTERPSVFTAQRTLANIDGLLRDLHTRLSRCRALPLLPLDEDVLRDWLIRRAHDRGLAISDTARDWLLVHLPRNPAHLDRALQQLDTAALACKKGRITLPFVRAVLGIRDQDPLTPRHTSAQNTA